MEFCHDRLFQMLCTGEGQSSREICSSMYFLDVNIDVLDTEGLYRRIQDMVYCENRSHKVMYVNPHCMVISRRDPEYRRILNSADLVYVDGIGIVWAAKLFGNHLPGRVTATDFMTEFCKGFARDGIDVYLLGARPGVAEKAAGKLKQAAPGLKVVGTHHGYFRQNENGELVSNIIKARPDVLLVGFGVPYQEKWIEENYRRLSVPVVWAVGGLFDFVSGRIKRGPKLLVDNGFEWLCRLFAEPTRLWRRYLIGNIQFAWYVLQGRIGVNGRSK